MSFKLIVRECIQDLEAGHEAVGRVISKLKDAGAIRNIHVGSDAFSEDQITEWYAGQILDVLENEAFFAVNSLINCVDKFAPID
jgi:hypothetical protein